MVATDACRPWAIACLHARSLPETRCRTSRFTWQTWVAARQGLRPCWPQRACIGMRSHCAKTRKEGGGREERGRDGLWREVGDGKEVEWGRENKRSGLRAGAPHPTSHTTQSTCRCGSERLCADKMAAYCCQLHYGGDMRIPTRMGAWRLNAPALTNTGADTASRSATEPQTLPPDKHKSWSVMRTAQQTWRVIDSAALQALPHMLLLEP